MQATIIVLRLIHILSGMFWVGSTLFTAFFLFPVLATVGPAAGPVMGGLKNRGLLKALPASAGLTVLSGLSLIWMISGGAIGAYASTPTGSTFLTAGGIAIIAFVFGMVVVRPAAEQAMQLGGQVAMMPQGAERTAAQNRMAALQARARKGSLTVSIMLVLAVAGMAVARYMT